MVEHTFIHSIITPCRFHAPFLIVGLSTSGSWDFNTTKREKGNICMKRKSQREKVREKERERERERGIHEEEGGKCC